MALCASIFGQELPCEAEEVPFVLHPAFRNNCSECHLCRTKSYCFPTHADSSETVASACMLRAGALMSGILMGK